MVASCPAIFGGHSKSQFFQGATSKSHPAAFFFAPDGHCNAAADECVTASKVERREM